MHYLADVNHTDIIWC